MNVALIFMDCKRLRKPTHIFACSPGIISHESINFKCLNISSDLHNWVSEVIKSQGDILIPELVDIDGEICSVHFLDNIGHLHSEEIVDFDNGASGYGHCNGILLDLVHRWLWCVPYLLLDLQYPFVSWDVFEFG